MRPWIYFALLVTTSTTVAADAQALNSLTLDQAIINVLEHNPVLKAADYDAKAAAARIRAATLSPALHTSLEFENFTGSGAYKGSDSLESTLSLAKVFELGDKASLRGELAQDESILLRNEQDAKRLDLLTETTNRFIHVVTDQERLVIAQDSLKLAEQTLGIVKRRVDAGRTPDAELLHAQNLLARKQLELEHAEHELATTRLKLATLWGEMQTPFSDAKADLYAIEPAIPFENLATLLEQNPDLLRFATEKRLAQTRIQLAQAKGSMDIELKAGIRHFNATDDTGFVLSMNVPFGTSSRAQPLIDEAEALSMRDPHLQEERRLTLYATLFEVHQEIKHAVEAVTALRKVIIPNAEQALKEYEKGYSLGRYSFLELTEAQNALLGARLEAVMTATEYHSLRTEIDRLTGAKKINTRNTQPTQTP